MYRNTVYIRQKQSCTILTRLKVNIWSTFILICPLDFLKNMKSSILDVRYL